MQLRRFDSRSVGPPSQILRFPHFNYNVKQKLVLECRFWVKLVLVDVLTYNILCLKGWTRNQADIG